MAHDEPSLDEPLTGMAADLVPGLETMIEMLVQGETPEYAVRVAALALAKVWEAALRDAVATLSDLPPTERRPN